MVSPAILWLYITAEPLFSDKISDFIEIFIYQYGDIAPISWTNTGTEIRAAPRTVMFASLSRRNPRGKCLR